MISNSEPKPFRDRKSWSKIYKIKANQNFSSSKKLYQMREIKHKQKSVNLNSRYRQKRTKRIILRKV